MSSERERKREIGERTHTARQKAEGGGKKRRARARAQQRNGIVGHEPALRSGARRHRRHKQRWCRSVVEEGARERHRALCCAPPAAWGRAPSQSAHRIWCRESVLTEGGLWCDDILAVVCDVKVALPSVDERRARAQTDRDARRAPKMWATWISRGARREVQPDSAMRGGGVEADTAPARRSFNRCTCFKTRLSRREFRERRRCGAKGGFPFRHVRGHARGTLMNPSPPTRFSHSGFSAYRLTGLGGIHAPASARSLSAAIQLGASSASAR